MNYPLSSKLGTHIVSIFSTYPPPINPSKGFTNVHSIQHIEELSILAIKVQRAHESH